MTISGARRAFCLLLAICPLLVVLGACDTFTGEVAQTGDISEPSYDYAAAGDRYTGDTLIMTADGSGVYWEEFYYWLLTAVSNILSEEGAETIEDWDAVLPYAESMFGEEMTYGEFVVYYARDAVTMYRAIDAKFEEEGLTLDEGEVFSKEDYMEAYGLQTEEEFLEYLEASYMTEELWGYIETVAAKYYMLLASVYGENGDNLTDEEVLEYVDSYGYIRAKHIMLYIQDEDGEDYSQRKKAEILKDTEDILALLDSYEGVDPEGYFDELTEKYSEDTGMGDGGYIFAPGDMTDEFETAAGALDENEHSGIVETDYGYHIILRLPMDLDAVPYGRYDTLRYLAADTRFDSIVAGWQEEMELEYSDVYKEIIPMDIFTAS